MVRLRIVSTKIVPAFGIMDSAERLRRNWKLSSGTLKRSGLKRFCNVASGSGKGMRTRVSPQKPSALPKRLTAAPAPCSSAARIPASPSLPDEALNKSSSKLGRAVGKPARFAAAALANSSSIWPALWAWAYEPSPALKPKTAHKILRR